MLTRTIKTLIAVLVMAGPGALGATPTISATAAPRNVPSVVRASSAKTTPGTATTPRHRVRLADGCREMPVVAPAVVSCSDPMGESR
jgi:hypothetical protein